MVDEETAEDDADAFECETCPVAEALASLDGPNRRAWQLYNTVVTRLAADLHAGGVVLDRLTRELDPDDFEDCWGRLTMLYHAINPVKRRAED